jgi:hypothetical protein
VDPIRDGIPAYAKIVKQPRDLTTIQANLSKGMYRSVEEWEADIELIWSNAEKFNGTGSMIHVLAQAMAAKCAKLKQNLKLLAPQSWVSRVTELFEQVNNRLESPPGFLKPHFEGKEFPGPVGALELERFCTASSRLVARADVLQLVQLIALFGVTIEQSHEKAVIPVKTLPADSLQTLISFMKDRFRAMKIPYPT